MARLSQPSFLDVVDDESRESQKGLFPSHEEISVRARDAGPVTKLAEHQQDAVEALSRHFRSGRKTGLLHVPTGGGKTLIALSWLLNEFVASRKRVLWVTHRIELLDQAHEKIRQYAHLLRERRPILEVSRVVGKDRDATGDIVLASAMTLVRSGMTASDLVHDGRRIDIVCYDEAHRCVAERTHAALQRIRRNGGAPLLGLTATPYRQDHESMASFTTLFGEPAYHVSFNELCDAKFLARPKVFHLQIDSRRVREMRPAEQQAAIERGDLPDEFLAQIARDNDRSRQVIDAWAARFRNDKTIVFACGVEHAEYVADYLRKLGVRAEALHTALDESDRRERMKSFRGKDTQVLVGVNILTEGIDVPDVVTVVMLRPTMSRSLYLQMIGRAARRHGLQFDKPYFNVMDCVDNALRHVADIGTDWVAEEFGVTAEVVPPPVASPIAVAAAPMNIGSEAHGAAHSFIQLAYAVALADSTIDESETRVIADAARDLAGPYLRPDEIESWMQSARTARAEYREVCFALQKRVNGEPTWLRRVLGFLIEVALADGRLDDRERDLVRMIGPYMGVPTYEADRWMEKREALVRERLAKTVAKTPACPFCAQTFEAGAVFCGLCGRRIDVWVDEKNRPVEREVDHDVHQAADDKEDWVECPRCSTLTPAASQCCESCRQPMFVPMFPTPADTKAGGASNAPGNPVRGSTSRRASAESGLAAERAFGELLDGLDAGKVKVLRQTEETKTESITDFTLRQALSNRTLRIELKCISSSPGASIKSSIHWSFRQIHTAKEANSAGEEYYLVIAVFRGNEYEYYWSSDPLKQFLDTERSVTLHAESAPEPDTSRQWKHLPAAFPAATMKQSSGSYEIRVADDLLGDLTPGLTRGPLDPVVAWLSRGRT